MPVGWRNSAGSLLLVTMAVAGVLSMHGLDGAVASLTEPSHSSHGPAGDGVGHETLGICVFVAAVTCLVIAALGTSLRGGSTARFADIAQLVSARSARVVAGRSRLIHLCVLRL
jgi:hypothetical protein